MKRFATTLTLIAGLGAGSAQAAGLLVYEGFGEYAAGTNVSAPMSGGIGFTGSWAETESSGSTPATVYDGTLSGSWDGEFNNAAVDVGDPVRYWSATSATSRLGISRTLASNAGTLAGDDDVLWASIVWTQNGDNFGRHIGFGLGTDPLSNRSQDVSNNGDFIGVGGAINTTSLTPIIMVDGGNDGAGLETTRTTTGAPSVQSSTDPFLIVLKYTFADGALADTVEAWAFAEGATISEAEFNTNAISASRVIDQDTLDTLTIAQTPRGFESFDEIRLGDGFADVTAPTVIPEPASGAMALVGLGAMAMRRRRG